MEQIIYMISSIHNSILFHQLSFVLFHNLLFNLELVEIPFKIPFGKKQFPMVHFYSISLYSFRISFLDPVVVSNTAKTISYATAGADTRTTQLFINYIDNKRLDSLGFSPFGTNLSIPSLSLNFFFLSKELSQLDLIQPMQSSIQHQVKEERKKRKKR